MVRIRRRDERGHANYGWLDTFHTFSFNTYYDPDHVHFGHLRVMNEDRVAPGRGFGTHPHRDMEIVTYVLEGALEHRDSTGGQGIIGAGEVQRMTAGSGIEHSEFNASKSEPVHLYQIWILPDRKGLEPGYEQKRLERDDLRGRWSVVAAKEPGDGALAISQNARILATRLLPGEERGYDLATGRRAWIQVASGKVTLRAAKSSELVLLEAGDGAAITDETGLAVAYADGGEPEVLLFDLA